MLRELFLKPAFKIAAFIASCVLYLLTILAAYGGRFDTDFFTFPAMLTLFLPYMAVATLVVTVIWLACRKLLAGALGILAVICSWGPVSSASPVAFSKSMPSDADSFTLMSWNILSGKDQQHPDAKSGNRTIEYIINSGADIVCVQELKALNNKRIPNLTPSLLDSLKKAYPYIVGTEELDTKLFSKYPAKYIDTWNFVSDNPNYDRRRYTIYNVRIHGRDMIVVNLHLMSYKLTEEERNVVRDMKSVDGIKGSIGEIKGSIYDKMHAGFKKRKSDAITLREILKNFDGPLIVCGDFNDVPESYAYRIIKGDDMKDAYAETGFGPLVTYNRHAFWFHLDQILYRGPLKALSVKKGTIKSSDHYPLTAEFIFTK